jgi:hypothetical protein
MGGESAISHACWESCQELGRSGPLLSHGRYEFFLLPIHLFQDTMQFASAWLM